MTPDLAFQLLLKRLVGEECALIALLPKDIGQALPISADLVGISRAQVFDTSLKAVEVLLDVNLWTLCDELPAVQAFAVPILSALAEVQTRLIEDWCVSNITVQSTRYFCERLGNRSVAHGTIALSALLKKVPALTVTQPPILLEPA